MSATGSPGDDSDGAGDPAPSPIMDLNGVDSPGDITTTEILTPGYAGEVSGTVAGGDHDWYRVTLVAGQQYAFVTEWFGGTSPDPTLALHNSAGATLAFNDNIASGLTDALIIYTPQLSGTYYLDVGQSGGTGSADYSLDMGLSLSQPDLVAGNTSTSATLAVGGAVDGVIETFGDSDWYAIHLTAGQSYLFTLDASGSPALEDPYLELYSSSGAVLTFNDDAGDPSGSTVHNTNSAMRYTPTTSGTYFLAAEAFSIQTGGYELTAATVAPQNPLNTIDWGTKVSNQNISIYFAQAGETFNANTATQNWSASQIAAVLAAGGEYASVANLTFTQTNSAAGAGMIMVLNGSLDSGVAGEMTTPSSVASVGVFNPIYLADNELQQGGYGLALILHEMGHGLGMAHPHDNGGTSEVMEGVTSPFGSYGDALLNQGVFTVMTYNNGEPAVSGGNPTGLTSGYQATPMALDVALMQEKYGAVDHNTGDTTYTLESIAGQYQAIWDTGGADTISYSGSADATIDLRPATPTLNQIGGGGYVSSLTNQNQAGGHGGYTIAAGVVIENAIGGSGNDILIGNDADNVLTGGAGSDQLDGGGGNNTASYSNAPSAVTVSIGNGGLQNTGGAGNDQLTNIQNLIGSSFDDILSGDGGANTLNGGPGSDTVTYLAAAGGVTVSLALSGAQNTGGAGIDTLISIENLIGSHHDDVLTGDVSANILDGGDGNDTLDGGGGIDTVTYAAAQGGVTVSLAISSAQNTGGDGVDTLLHIENLIGSISNDTLTGDGGANILTGGSGADLLDGGAGNDTLDGGGGTDTASYGSAASGVTVSLAISAAQATGGDGVDTLVSIENLTGSAFNDVLTGDGGDNLIRGGAGNDTIDGGAGNDTAVFAGLRSAYVVTPNGTTVTVAGPDGTDTLTNVENFQFDDQTIQAVSSSPLTINDSDLGHVLTGGSGDDVINGNGGDDTITGLAGNDIIDGGLGNDILDGGPGTDTVSYASAPGNIMVELNFQGTQRASLNAGNDTLFNFENVIGSSFDDTLVASDGNNVIDGGAGWDRALYIYATAGVTVNLAITGPQNTGGSGVDTLLNIEQVEGSAFNDVLTGNDGANILAGNQGNNFLSGAGGDDQLYGGTGNDTFDGGAGNDIVWFSAARSAYAITDHGGGSATVTGPDGTDTLINVESLRFTDQTVQLFQAPVTINDSDVGNSLVGTSGNDVINANGGDDVLDGLGGDDMLAGGTGNDLLDGGPGNDTLDGGPGFNTVTYDSATAGITVSLAISAPQNTGGSGTDTLINIGSLIGSPFNDVLTGQDDTKLVPGFFYGLFGEDGDDILAGGLGDHSLDGGAGNDTVTYAWAASGVTVSLGLTTPQDTGGGGTDYVLDFENITGSAFNDTLAGDGGSNVLDGGAGTDIASYASAASGVTVSLAIATAQVTGGAGVDTLVSIEGLTGSAFNDTLTGDANVNVIHGGAGNDVIDGGGNVDTAVFSGLASAYTITHSGDVATVVGPDGTDTLTNVEYFQFADQTIHFLPGVGTAVNFSADPSTFMGAIRDFDGNDLGDASGWQKIGTVDIQGDGTPEQIFVNSENGRWASVGTGPDGLVYFDDHGWAGDTRVVGIYIDPLVQSGEVVQGSDFDSQRRFQNDLFINNIHGILGAGDYDHNGLQEVYFSLTDGTAYLHAYMHADGNIEYANYQSEAQVISYLTSEGFGPSTWAGWFPDGGHQTSDLVSL